MRIPRPKLRELKEAIRSLLSRPYTSDFPKKPHTPYKRFRGKPEYFEDGCVCCTACSFVCPAKAIEYNDVTVDGKHHRKMTLHFDICHYCGQCEANCITQEGVKLSNKFDLALFDRNQAQETVQHELALCEMCQEPITTWVHLKWISDKIGVMAFSNPTLFLSSLAGLGVTDAALAESIKEFMRSDRMKILCSKCRRKTTLER